MNTLEAFYRGLAYDDAFRKRLMEDPKATLKQLGIELPIEEIALPTKGAVVEALQTVTFGQEFTIRAQETLGWGWWAAWAVFALQPSQLFGEVKAKSYN